MLEYATLLDLVGSYSNNFWKFPIDSDASVDARYCDATFYLRDLDQESIVPVRAGLSMNDMIQTVMPWRHSKNGYSIVD